MNGINQKLELLSACYNIKPQMKLAAKLFNFTIALFKD